MTSRMPHTRCLILASSSPRRRALLALLVDVFDVVPADIDESRSSGETPEDYVLRMAREKAVAVAQKVPARAVLGADTTVVVDNECLGKPADRAEATDMLVRLSGRAHQVMSAVAMVDETGAVQQVINRTEVCFADLPGDWIERYVASGEPMDKAGAYGIQGAAAAWIEHIAGSFSGVVGLPLFETAALLRANNRLK